MCDARDLGVAVGENSAVEEPAAELSARKFPYRVQQPKIFEPNIYLYDKYPGGVGFSEPLFRLSETLLENTGRLIVNCPCAAGCPSCVGPVGEVGEKGKEVALEILRRILSSAASAV
jgi:DEAD/DEAH box helicase domain-containing protein